LTGLVEFHDSAALPEVIRTFRHAEGFAISVERIIDKLGFAALSTPTPQSPTEERPGHSRRLSKRMSISRRTAPNRASISIPGGAVQGGSSPWEQALFEPFVDLQSDYPTLEKRYLDQSLDSLLVSRRLARSDVEARTRALREQALDIITFAEEALDRCTTFTHGYGAHGLVEATDHMFAAFLEHVKSDLLETSRTGQQSGTDDYDEFEMSPEDLKAFQLGLNLLGVGKLLRERLLTLEVRYRVSFIQFAQVLRGAAGAIQSLGPPLPGTTKGEAELLSQSALNSLQLNTLLDTIDPQGALLSTPFLGPGPSIFSQPLSAARGESFAQQQQPSHVVSLAMLKGSRLAIKEYARTTQQFLQNVILAPLFQHLSGYPSLAAWTTPDQKKRPAYEFAVPTFSLSSTPTVQKLSEGLLALPRMFEVYVGDEEALAFSIETLPFLEMDPGLCELVDSHLSAMSQFEISSTSPSSKRDGSPSMRRTSLSGPSAFTSPPITQPPPPMTAEMVSSAWLSCLALALLSQLTDKILPTFRALTGTGAAQLAYDLGYLSTIVRALNVEWEPLEKWRSYCELSNEEGKKRYLGATGVTAFASALDEKIELDDILKHVAKIRGWTTVT
jgi:conserved oligomeric Golgi complex subunit 7